MKNSFKLNLVAAAVLMAGSVAHAGTANLPGAGSVGNAYQMGVISPTPTVLGVLLTGSPTSFLMSTQILLLLDGTSRLVLVILFC